MAVQKSQEASLGPKWKCNVLHLMVNVFINFSYCLVGCSMVEDCTVLSFIIITVVHFVVVSL